MKVSSVVFVALVGISAAIASPVEKQRLIKRSEADPGVWMTEAEVVQLRVNGVGFVDITNDREFTLNVPARPNAIPTVPRNQQLVNDLIRTANLTRVQDFIRDFTSFFNRYYQADSGVQSEKWLLSEVIGSLQRYEGDTSIREVRHEWRQNSIVARIEGSDPVLMNEVVVIGSHEDSISGGENPVNISAPGADDNASGSAVTLEVLRILVNAGFRPKRTIDFHWYAAEEMGLWGSADVAKEYADNNVTVAAMLNLDVVGFQPPNQREIAVFTDNANDQLVEFMRVLADEYLDFDRKDKACGYACSDHASWTRNGYAAVFVGEPEGNPDVHSPRDTYETVGFEQIMEFVKLAVGFAIEVSEQA